MHKFILVSLAALLFTLPQPVDAGLLKVLHRVATAPGRILYAVEISYLYATDKFFLAGLLAEDHLNDENHYNK